MSIALPQTGRASARPNIAAGILWYLLRGNRHRLTATIIYWIVMTVLSHTLFSGVLATYDSLALSSLAIISLLPLSGLMLFIIGQFGMTISFDDAFKGYPSHLLRLPSSSAALAVWPMVFGIPTVCIAWVVLEKTVLTPIGIPTQDAMPCLGLCASLILCQCVTWAPLTPAPRLFLYTAALGLVGGSAFAIGFHDWHRLPFIACYSASIVLGVPLAIACVSASRRGEVYTPDFLRPIGERIGALLRRRPDIDATDGRRAQAWFDYCIEGAPMPAALIFFTVATLPFLFNVDRVSLVGPSESGWPIAGIRVLPWVFVVVMLGPLVATLLGGLLGHNPLPSTIAFLRPLTSTEIAASKLRAALVSAWATIGVVALFGCLALLTPATDGPVHGILGALLLRDLTPSRVPTIILAIVLFMLVVVRARVDGIWSSVLRNHWLATIQLIGPTLAFVTLMIWNSFGNVVGYFLTVHQSEIATAAVVVKVMGVVVAFVVLKRHRLITTSTIARQVAVWLVTSIGLAALTLAAVSWTTALPMTVVALSPVLVPIVSVSLIPWAIDKARHQ